MAEDEIHRTLPTNAGAQTRKMRKSLEQRPLSLCAVSCCSEKAGVLSGPERAGSGVRQDVLSFLIPTIPRRLHGVAYRNP